MKYLLLFLLFANDAVLAQYSNLPISLSLPYDRDTIEETEPVLTWQCNTAALQNDPRLDQQIVVAELLEDQSPAEAIAVNPAIFIRQQLLTGSITYSGTDHPLEQGKSYVWQVSCLFNGIVVQQSETWVFTLAKPVPPRQQYLALRRTADGSVYTTGEPALYIRIAESGQLSLAGTVRAASGEKFAVKLVPAGKEDEDAKTYSSTGELLCKVDFEDLDLSKGAYVFSWKAPNGNQYHLNFNYTK